MTSECTASSLLGDVFECSACEGRGFGFSRPAEDRPSYKFPPTIGATGIAPLLFVGINPRISPGNRWLHELIMGSRVAFENLSRNQVNGQSYIAKTGGESHYNYHLRLVECVFGEGARFEDHAAVTELFLCAKETSTGLPSDHSPCADRFLERTMLQVRPRVVIAVGKPVEDYFRNLELSCASHFDVNLAGIAVTVVVVPHPNFHGPRLDRWGDACRLTKAVLSIGSTPSR
jgi:hypothetical protein